MESTIKVGDWVKSLRDFAQVPAGTLGRVCEDDGEVIAVAWRLGGYEPHEDTDRLWLIDPRAPRIRDYFRYRGGAVDETQWLMVLQNGRLIRHKEGGGTVLVH